MRFVLLGACVTAAAAQPASAQNPPSPALSITVSNGQKWVRFAPYPAADEYVVQSVGDLSQPFTNDPGGRLSGFMWTASNSAPAAFHRLAVTPLSSNALLSANVLNRLAYGPTPDDLERLALIGPQAYLEEQLAPENIVEDQPGFVAITTNGITLPPVTNWTFVSVTGRVTSSTLYLYLTKPGELLIDDVELRLIQTVTETNLVGTNVVVTTSTVLGSNVVINGDFEAPLTPAWSSSGNHTGSGISAELAHAGGGSLKLVATGIGTGSGSSVSQVFSPSLPTASSQRCVLSFWYVQNAVADRLVSRLSGTGTVISGARPPPTPTWYYVTATGRATSTPVLYLYLSGAGEAYLDEIKLVSGTVPESGPNLLSNGDFEAPLTNGWRASRDFTNSTVSTNFSFSGNGSLKLIATAAGGGNNDSVSQSGIAGVTSGGIYTISFWYIPGSSGRTLTVRLSGSITAGLLQATPDTTLAGITRRLETFGGRDIETGLTTSQSIRGASLADLRAWHVMNAVGSKRQLLEVLTQFLENHFVTEHDKSYNYLDGPYNDTSLRERIATDWEYREVRKWRAALSRADCTFYDLLKVSAESPAMIVYLDTVNSKGNGNNIANENFARELFELFCMGVDNGYDQNDIVAMSRAWSGWSVDIVDPENIDNPLAPQSSTFGFYPGSGFNAQSNRVGVWSFRFKPENHGTNRAPILSEWDPTTTNLVAVGPKIVPARFGPPWAGTPYQLVLPTRGTGSSEGLQDGYDVIQHLANLPMTMEYLSIKLCRLFVHDDFPNPTTKPGLPEYEFYDYTRPDLTPEARLVHDCMLAWWNSDPRGNLRAVLRTIFGSALFRSHAGSAQKIKTPLEFAVSSVRALRSANDDGTFTASTDGYSISGRDRAASSSPLTRMGQMMLFDREAPDGYPEDGPPWISAGTLAERIRFVQTALMPASDSKKSDGIAGGNLTLTEPVQLLKKKLPAGSWRNAVDVATFFVWILFPAEGHANLEQYRQLAIQYLNTADDGVAASPFANLSDTSTTYDTRVRGLVAMLMTLPRFQEQ